MNHTDIDLEKLDEQVSKALNLPPGSLFVLAVDDSGKLMEFVYPTELTGNMVPINARSILGRAVSSRRYYISNNAYKEKDLSVLNCLSAMGSKPVRKVITYPIVFMDEFVALLEVVRKGDGLTETPNFEAVDVDRIREVIDQMFSLHAVETA